MREWLGGCVWAQIHSSLSCVHMVPQHDRAQNTQSLEGAGNIWEAGAERSQGC